MWFSAQVSHLHKVRLHPWYHCRALQWMRCFPLDEQQGWSVDLTSSKKVSQRFFFHVNSACRHTKWFPGANQLPSRGPIRGITHLELTLSHIDYKKVVKMMTHWSHRCLFRALQFFLFIWAFHILHSQLLWGRNISSCNSEFYWIILLLHFWLWTEEYGATSASEIEKVPFI